MVTLKHSRAVGETFLLDKARRRAKDFAALRPTVISSRAGLRSSLAHATRGEAGGDRHLLTTRSTRGRSANRDGCNRTSTDSESS